MLNGALRTRRVCFGPFELDVRAGELRKHDVRIRLQEQPFQILIMLLEQPGEIILREEIRKRLWPNDTIVEFDHSINAAIKRLRDALSDSAETPRYVETVARRGYRFIGVVTSDPEAVARPADAGAIEAPTLKTGSDWTAVGRIVSHYRLLEKLGHGGMGEVYKARDTRLERDVALKILPEDFATDNFRRERFEREARSVASLNHPNIVALFDIGNENGVPYMVTEFVDGHTLRAVQVPPREAIAIAAQAAEGLAAAHAAGVVHRDIKPDNVMVTRDGRVKILDFGLAKTSAQCDIHASNDHTLSSTDSNAMMGTSGYMSPEQIRSAEVDHRSDIFSFGALLYELLSGKRAFQADSASGEMNAVLNENPPPLPESLPAGVRDIVRRCLEKNLENRFQSAQDLAFALRAVKTADSATTPVTSRFRVWRWAAVVLLIVGLMAGVNFPNRIWRTSQPPKVTSLAVLPPVDLSTGSEEELNFTDGLTDTLIAEIGQILGKNIRVISRTTMMRYKDTHKTLQEIARELEVDAVLESSVRRASGTFEINATLKNAREERLWGSSYRREYADILKLQRDLARDIAIGINLELTPEDEGRLANVERVNPEAHKDYLAGLQHLYERSIQGMAASEEYFKSAIEKDPNYATAHAGLGESYILQGYYGLLIPAEAYPNAKQAANTALSLDSKNASAHNVLARVRSEYERDYSAAEAEYKLALHLNPNLEVTYRWYGLLLTALGRFDEALMMKEQEEVLDPQAAFLAVNTGSVFYMARRYEESIEEFRKAVQKDPDTQQAVDGLAQSYLMAGRHREAFEYYQRWAKLVRMSQRDVSALDRAFAAQGMKGYWRRRLEIETAEEEKTGNVWSYHRALLHARVANNEEALRWLEKAFDENHPRLIYLNVEPAFDGIRSEARFMDLIRKLKLL